MIEAAWREIAKPLQSSRQSKKIEETPVVQGLARVGYKVLREVHRGGQGVVYEATQQSTDRSVAIKVLREGPVADPEERARFNLEVRVLARLKHPNIVTVHDSGEVGGFYYIVMDYVRGEALDDYVLHEEPDTRSLLALFANIADAVAAAHRNGIIHRDLKPSNIRIDEVRAPKVLDFGLAKLTEPETGGGPGITQTGHFLGSIPWASPEQAEGRQSLIDIRTDVYSLGVMLFQILTRRFPYDVTGSVRQTLDAIVNIDPPRPSTIVRGLDSEIDGIVLKALAKEPGQRYQTAHELAEDIRRYLAGEPIQARSASTLYVLGKLLRRHRTAITVVVAFALLITGAGWVAASLRRKSVEIKKQSMYSESDLFRDLLETVNPQGIVLPAEQVRKKLEQATQRLDSEFGELPEARANLQHAIGVTYRRVGSFDPAIETLGEALQTRKEIYQPPNPKIAETLHELGAAHWHNAQFSVAENYYRQALEQRRKLFGEKNILVADTMNHLAACLNSQGSDEEAKELYRRVLELRISLLGPSHSDVAAVMNNLATCLRGPLEKEEAIGLFRQAIDMMRDLHGEQHPFVAQGMTNLANRLIEEGRLEEADELLQAALRIKRQTLRADHPSAATTLHRLAEVRLKRADFDAATTYADEAVAIRRNLREGHPDLAASLSLAGRIRLTDSNAADAQPLLDEAWRLYLKLDQPPQDPRRLETLLSLTDCEARLGRSATACATLNAELSSLKQANLLTSDIEIEWRSRCETDLDSNRK